MATETNGEKQDKELGRSNAHHSSLPQELAVFVQPTQLHFLTSVLFSQDLEFFSLLIHCEVLVEIRCVQNRRES